MHATDPTRRRAPRLVAATFLTLLLAACAAAPPPPPAPPPPEPVVFKGPTPEEVERSRQLACLTQAIYFEARGESEIGKRAVGYVVLNRVGSPKFPDTVCGVIRQGGPQPPCQFSWYCDGRADTPKEPQAWAEAQRVAAEVISRSVPDPTHGAQYFHNRNAQPAWKDKFKSTAEIQGHIYYRAIEEGGPTGAGG